MPTEVDVEVMRACIVGLEAQLTAALQWARHAEAERQAVTRHRDELLKILSELRPDATDKDHFV